MNINIEPFYCNIKKEHLFAYESNFEEYELVTAVLTQAGLPPTVEAAHATAAQAVESMGLLVGGNPASEIVTERLALSLQGSTFRSLSKETYTSLYSCGLP